MRRPLSFPFAHVVCYDRVVCGDRSGGVRMTNFVPGVSEFDRQMDRWDREDAFRRRVARDAVTCVTVEDGCGQDSDGDDVHEWYVTPCDDDGEQVEGTKSVTCYSEAAAWEAAEEMSRRYGGVEVVNA